MPLYLFFHHKNTLNNMKTSIDILLVEDNLDDAALTIGALKEHNLAQNLMHFTDGEELLHFLYGKQETTENEQKAMPKVIFMDLKMPRMNGLEVLEKIKSDPSTRSVPIVVLSSSYQSAEIEKAYDLGANSLVVKPENFERYRHTIAEMGAYWMATNKI
jgi:CheY-like chemotaxis protein